MAPTETRSAPLVTLTDWLSRTDTVRLVCRDKGHWWPSDNEAEREDFPALGMTAIRESCLRGCGVSRTRYLGLDDGTLMKASAYAYPPGYLTRVAQRDGWFMDKATNGKIRLEIRARKTGQTGVEI